MALGSHHLLKQESTRTEMKRPIFIVGCPRSGTTLLQQMLDAHPDIAIAPETFFIRHFWLQRERYGDLENDANYHRLIRDIVKIPEFKEMGLNATEFSHASSNIDRKYPSVFQLLLGQFAQKRQVKIVGEKTPNHLLYMPTIQKFFPLARFIHIVRDPRAVVNSWQKVPWTTGSPGGDAEVWRRYMSTARLCSDTVKSSLFTLHYEDLVLAPEKNIRDLCLFLNIEFSSSMLNHAENKDQLVNVVREPWKVNAKKPVNQTSLDRWRAELSKRTVFEIETIVRSEMNYLGYGTCTSPVQIFFWKAYKTFKRRYTHAISSLWSKESL